MISFTIPTTPKSTQLGNRACVTKSGKLRFFSDDKKINYQATITLFASQFKPQNPITGPVEVHIKFIVPRPQGLMGKKHDEGLIPCGKRPDVDNCYKGTCDALSKCGFWLDDGQIFKATIEKYYHEKAGAPRIEVQIKSYESTCPKT